MDNFTWKIDGLKEPQEQLETRAAEGRQADCDLSGPCGRGRLDRLGAGGRILQRDGAVRPYQKA